MLAAYIFNGVVAVLMVVCVIWAVDSYLMKRAFEKEFGSKL
jgi:hypothetical protein